MPGQCVGWRRCLTAHGVGDSRLLDALAVVGPCATVFSVRSTSAEVTAGHRSTTDAVGNFRPVATGRPGHGSPIERALRHRIWTRWNWGYFPPPRSLRTRPGGTASSMSGSHRPWDPGPRGSFEPSSSGVSLEKSARPR